MNLNSFKCALIATKNRKLLFIGLLLTLFAFSCPRERPDIITMKVFYADTTQYLDTTVLKSIYPIKKMMTYSVELDANTDSTVFELITRNRIDTFAVYYSKIINDELEKISFDIYKINSKTLVSKILNNQDTSYNVGDINLFFR